MKSRGGKHLEIAGMVVMQVRDDDVPDRVGGHSDGLQVVRVETARGPVVLASDAAHYYGNLHRRSPFPIVYNIGDMCVGWETVERLAGHPDRIIPGHDPIVSEIYPRASDKVDAFSLHLAPSRSFVK